jgi:predicted protein tyrosine phosphatase
MRLLFLCSRNKLRSPTAEAVFGVYPEHEVDSAGLNDDAVQPLDAEQVRWAEIIFVMEPGHRRRLTQKFGKHLAGKKVVCLNIPDNYAFMDTALVVLLESRVTPHLRRG